MKQQKKNHIVLNVILVLIIVGLLITIQQIYRKYNFNDYSKTEYTRHGSQFLRDANIKYADMDSYCIQSQDYNDAMFYKTIKVTPNTPYKVTCMVKVQDIQTQQEVSNAGANIAIADTVEKSKSITGTSDWQKIELLFDSKNREEVKVGFRLGSYDDNCKGTAWFSDFTIESGIQSSDTEWKFACFIFQNTDVIIDKDGSKEHISLAMNQQDISSMEDNIRRFEQSIQSLSGYHMSANMETYKIDSPITSLSYDEENGYYVAPKNIASIIDPYLEKKEYDHIFVAVRLGDVMTKKEIPVNDWIGLRIDGLSGDWIF